MEFSIKKIKSTKDGKGQIVLVKNVDVEVYIGEGSPRMPGNGKFDSFVNQSVLQVALAQYKALATEDEVKFTFGPEGLKKVD